MDPHRPVPKAVRGLVKVEVLMEMTYLDGKFWSVGSTPSVPVHEAEAAIKLGAARAPQDAQ